MTINEKLFKLLEEKHIKQAELAAALNIRTSVIGNWKTRGTNPPAEYITHICDFLEIPVSELIGTCKYDQYELITIYNKLTAEDKAIVDIIFDKYKNEDVKLLDSKIS